MPYSERTPALVGVRGSGFRQAARLDSPDENIETPSNFQQIGSVAGWIIARVAAKHDLPHRRAALIVHEAGIGGMAAE